MEIIDELERDARGPYAGCIGYFGARGEMDTCIVLRTAVVKDGVMSVQAGAGIVHDSVNASEQTECVNKAKALFKAAEEACASRREPGAGSRGIASAKPEPSQSRRRAESPILPAWMRRPPCTPRSPTCRISPCSSGQPWA